MPLEPNALASPVWHPLCVLSKSLFVSASHPRLTPLWYGVERERGGLSCCREQVSPIFSGRLFQMTRRDDIPIRTSDSVDGGARFRTADCDDDATKHRCHPVGVGEISLRVNGSPVSLPNSHAPSGAAKSSSAAIVDRSLSRFFFGACTDSV